MNKVKFAVIGGSGLYNMPDLKIIDSLNINTPYGKPSDSITIGELENHKIAFLPRHGKGHIYNPTNIPVRANIYALKSLGVEWIISVSAVGSLKLEIKPRDMVIPDQIIDKTKSRVNTFFDDLAVHVGFSDPFCPNLSQIIFQTGKELGLSIHKGGIYVCMEGPLFSTKAESALHRSWGASLIGMTAIPEAKLAREAEICYAMVAIVTDYDVWHEQDYVSIDLILENLRVSVNNVQKLIKNVIPKIPPHRTCYCSKALENAIVTHPDKISKEKREKYKIFLGKYLN